MRIFNKVLALMFSYTLIWGSYELYHKMRLEEFMSLAGLGLGALSVACVLLAVAIAKAGIRA